MKRGRVLAAAAVIAMTFTVPLSVYANGPGVARGEAHSTEAAVPESTAQAELTREERISKRIGELINEKRTGEGRPVLAFRSELAESAVVRAGELPQKASHERPDGSRYLTAVNLAYNQIGENFAYANTPGMTEEEIAVFFVTAWMNSPVHHDNILKNDWTETGIGVHIQGDTVYAIQLFMEATSN